VTSGTVVVAIRISLALKLFDYSNMWFPSQTLIAETAFGWMHILLGKSLLLTAL
jgi:hypothetical protein